MSLFTTVKEKLRFKVLLWKHRDLINKERAAMKPTIVDIETVEPLRFPLCEECLQLAVDKFIRDGWITLYDDKVYAVMVEDDVAAKEHNDSEWICNSYHMRPSFDFDDGKRVAGYRPYPSDGVYHIVITQEEKCYHAEKIRLSEEFVLLYDLRLVERIDGSAEYYQVDENGDDILVAKVVSGCLKALASYVCEYISIKSMNLVIQFSATLYSAKSILELARQKHEYTIYRSKDIVFSYTLSEETFTEDKSFAWIQGKVFIQPDQSKIHRLFDLTDKRFESFIAGKNKDGNPITSTCEEISLSPNPTHNDTPWQLSLVFFKRGVLDRYYADTRKFSVQDGFLSGPSWTVHLDSDRGDRYVVIALKDLGKMPYKEQVHWKQYNVVCPDGVGLSDTTWNRWFAGIPSNTKNACDLLFKSLYEEANIKWESKHRYPLFLALAPNDQHFFDELHSMNELNNDSTFDNLILAFTKVVIDSLNEKQLENEIDETNANVLALFAKCNVKDNKKTSLSGGIRRLQAVLLSEGIDCDDLINLLGKIQALRSTSAAHRKSTNPDKKTRELLQWFEIDKYPQKDVIDNIFDRLNIQLKYLAQLCECEEGLKIKRLDCEDSQA